MDWLAGWAGLGWAARAAARLVFWAWLLVFDYFVKFNWDWA